MGQALATNLTAASAYLWTLPMFHCNGWCFTWAVTAVGATHVCLRRFDADIALEQIDKHQVTHFCGAPVVLNALADAKAKRQTDHTVRVMTGGAPPSPAVISRMSKLNIDVTHLYGLTETYGDPAKPWDDRLI